MSRDTAALRAQVRDSYATAEALEVYRKRADQGLRTWEAAVVHQHFPPTGRILTIGCGAGRETFALEQRGYDAVGVDISLPLLQIARELGAERHHHAAFHLVDGQSLPFSAGVFDAVTLWAQMLDNVPSRSARLALMREVSRVLRTGGLATYSVHDDARTRPQFAPGDVMSADFPEQGDFVIYEHRERAIRYCHLFTHAELAGLTHDAGFTEALIRHTSDFGETWDNVFVGVCRNAGSQADPR